MAAQQMENDRPILPQAKWWWFGLGMLLILAGWLYLRGYSVSLPFIEHHDELPHLLAAQHIVDFGHESGIHNQYPPGLKTLIYLLLKHIKPADAHHGTMLPALRLITIAVWMLVVVLVALLGAMMAHPLTGLMAAGIWIVNPWVVDRAHYLLPDGYVTCFTLLALWLALVGVLRRRPSFSTAATYSVMLAIAFKTQALFVAPLIIFLPLISAPPPPPRAFPSWQISKDRLRQTFWNCARFAVFLFWLLLIYPTLEADNIVHFPMSYDSMGLPSLDSAWTSLKHLLRTFFPLDSWLMMTVAGGLLLRYRRRVNGIAIIVAVLAALFWLLGMSMFNVRSLRHYFAVGAMMAILYACGLTGLLFAAQDFLSRLNDSRRLRESILPAALCIPLVIGLLPSYRDSDAMAHNYTLPDRRVDLMRYMDTSLEPGKFITEREEERTIKARWGRHLSDREWGNHKTFNRAWGGYDGRHDFPIAGDVYDLLDKPLELWRGTGAVYAIVPYAPLLADPDIYFPDETVLLKSFPPDANFRGPSMAVLRLYPIQNPMDGKLGTIRFVGFDINATRAAPGDHITFRFYWNAESATVVPHHVFNHLLDSGGRLVAQVDGIPLWDARRDTSTWDDPGEILVSREFSLRLPIDLPVGTYALVSGFYDPQSGKRLVAEDGSDYLSVSAIQSR